MTYLAFAIAAGALSLCGAGLVDAMVLATLAAVPRFLSPPDDALRRRRRRLEFPALLAFALLVASTVAATVAVPLRAALPCDEVALGACYVLAWTIALRCARAGVAAALHRLGAPPPVVKITAGAVLLLAGFPLLFASLQTHRLRIAPAQLPAGGVDVEFRAADGTRLAGTLLVQARAAPGLVLCHGLGANRAMLSTHARLAHDLGCHVLLFDFRAHGRSDGHVTTFGWRERLDVAAAVATLRRHAPVTTVALLGVSMGASAALLAAPECDVAGVFAESAFADLRQMTLLRFSILPDFAAAVLTNLVALAATVQPGVAIDQVAPRHALALLDGRRPVTLLHAGDDAVVPVHQGRSLAAARAGLQLEVFPGAMHGDCLGADPWRYRELLRRFVTAVARR